MAVDDFYIDIENSSGTVQGPGPITSARGWTYTARMDRAGTFAFAMPASDEMADEIQKKRIARAYALLGGTWTEVGAGIIDSIVKTPFPDGTVMLQVSGDSEERELTYRSVGFLELESAGAAITHSAALTAITALAPGGWTFTADASPGNDNVYGGFAGETVLQALVKLAEKSQSHFYRSGAKALTFASSFASSGVRAIRADGDLVAETCAIVNLQERIDTHELITRIYPYGAGQGQARLTLAATSRSAGAGFTLDAANNYIENDTAEASYGQIERYVEFKDIAPISNTDADLQAAANMLYDVALEELTRRSTEIEQATYQIRLAQCSALLRPMQTIRVVYWDPDAGMDVDADLNILEATLEVDASGLRTTGLVVSNADRWPDSDSEIIADEMAQGRIFQAHPQLNSNSYTTGYLVKIDDTETGTLRFRLGDEVVQVQSVLLDFQLLPFESSIRSITSTGSTSDDAGLHAHTVTIPAHSHSVTIPAHSHTTTIPAHSHTVTIASHSHTVTISGHSHTVTTSDHGHDVIIEGSDNPTGSYPLARIVYVVPSTQDFLVAQTGAGSDTAATSEDGGSESATSNTTSQATPTSSELAQTTPTSSELAQQTPSSDEAAQTVGSSSTYSESYPSSDNAGTHSHSFTPSLTTVYGIFREIAGNTYVLADLEYQVNSGSWVSLDTATSLGGDWYQLDITSDVVNATTFRPTTASNTVNIRKKSAAAADKTVQVDCLLSVRNIIQAIAYL